MVNQVARHWMRTSTIRQQAGFTLIEVLVVLALLGLVFALSTLAIPNHQERYWRDNVEALQVSLNAAQDEAALRGVPIVVEVDTQGWRFYQNTRAGSMQVMREPFAPSIWKNPVNLSPVQWQLGDEAAQSIAPLQLTQEQRQATLSRNSVGQFVVQFQTIPK
jgi:type II secretion system protein H